MVIKPLIKLHKSQKLHNKILQIQLEISLIKKYLKRDRNVQRKFKKLMEYQIIINLLGSTRNQPSKFRIKNRVKINDDARGIYSTNSQIKFKFNFKIKFM